MLVSPIVNASGQASSNSAGTKADDKAKPADPEKGAVPPAKTAMETLAQKQRDATLAAMQQSLEKQRAAVAAGVAADKKGAPAVDAPSFFNLPPMPAPANLPAAFAMPEAGMPDVDCQPVPEAQVAPAVEEAARREGLESRLIAAVIEQESGFRPCAISVKGAQGLMQLMPDTADRFGVKDPFDIKQNVDAGAKFLKELITRYNGDLSLALGAYNAGSGKVDAAGGVPDISETTNYVSEILKKLGKDAAAPKAINAISPAPAQ